MGMEMYGLGMWCTYLVPPQYAACGRLAVAHLEVENGAPLPRCNQHTDLFPDDAPLPPPPEPIPSEWYDPMDRDHDLPEGMEIVRLTGGHWLVAHARNLCSGDFCCIHRPSAHHMVYWPQNWRSDRRLMERICDHGTGHPDPDHAYRPHQTDLHGCDGCCTPPF